jgi:hypothetical protein
MKVLEGSERFVDVVGLYGHKAHKLRIVTAQALISTHKGDAIAMFHQMGLLGTGKSILSCLQMEAHGADINDISRHLPGGKQRILIDGYQLPLDFKNSLPYLQCQKPTDEELSPLPHIIMTSDVNWNPSKYDKDIDDIEKFHDHGEDDHDEYHFDQHGEYCHCTVDNHHTYLEEESYDACEFLDFDDQVDDLATRFCSSRCSQ